MSGNKQEDDDESLFQKEMAKTNTASRNYQEPRFSPYDHKDKPRVTIRSHNQPMSTNVPDCGAVDETEQGESVLFVRSGLQNKVIKRLKRGDYPCHWELDLHGRKIHEAETLLEQFLSSAIQQKQSCVLIIHGKGNHSENQKGVIKPFTINWLKQCAEIKAFCSATPKDGGTGAVYVLLKRASSKI